MQQPLQSLCRRMNGAVAASVIRADGVMIDGVRAESSSAELHELWADYSALLTQIRDSAQMLAAGTLEELLLSSERVVTVIRPLTSESFLALAVTPGASSGKARYLCRVTAPLLVEALPQ